MFSICMVKFLLVRMVLIFRFCLLINCCKIIRFGIASAFFFLRMKLTQKLQRIVCRGFFHRIFANNYRNERASNFPCKSLFTSHLFTHRRHASFYFKKQKYKINESEEQGIVLPYVPYYRAILLI